MNIVSEPRHLTALDTSGQVILGAFQPEGAQTWRLYLTDRLTREHHRCHPVVCNRADALQWVVLIAGLYERNTPIEYQLAGPDLSGIASHIGDQP